MILRLAPDQFSDDLKPIFDHIEKENGEPDRLDWSYFQPMWRLYMGQGIAQSWATEKNDAVLGAMFYKDIFNGDLHGVVNFWFSLPEARGTGRPIKLLDAFEAECDRQNVKSKKCAAFIGLTPEVLRHVLQKRGYKLTEEIWSHG